MLPVDDFGVRAGFQAAYGLSSMPHPKALLAFGERWRPHRSAAAWYLWRALELKREGTLPAPPQRDAPAAHHPAPPQEKGRQEIRTQGGQEGGAQGHAPARKAAGSAPRRGAGR